MFTFQPLLPATAQLQSGGTSGITGTFDQTDAADTATIDGALSLRSIEIQNYMFIRVGDGMGTTERIR